MTVHLPCELLDTTPFEEGNGTTRAVPLRMIPYPSQHDTPRHADLSQSVALHCSPGGMEHQSSGGSIRHRRLSTSPRERTGLLQGVSPSRRMATAVYEAEDVPDLEGGDHENRRFTVPRTTSY